MRDEKWSILLLEGGTEERRLLLWYSWRMCWLLLLIFAAIQRRCWYWSHDILDEICCCYWSLMTGIVDWRVAVIVVSPGCLDSTAAVWSIHYNWCCSVPTNWPLFCWGEISSYSTVSKNIVFDDINYIIHLIFIIDWRKVFFWLSVWWHLYTLQSTLHADRDLVCYW